MAICGVIFDLDGTLIDSPLNFDAIRHEMDLERGTMILEAIDALPDGPRKRDCLSILRRHELEGARRASLMPGVADFLQVLAQRGLPIGLLTRNSREAVSIVLERLGLQFNPVLTRNETPAKPDPTGLLTICQRWNLSVDEVVFFGDFLFDLEAGHNAGIRTVLYAPDSRPDFADGHEPVIECFSQAVRLIDSWS